MKLEEKEKLEINFWKNSKGENPDIFHHANFLNKISHAKILDRKFRNHLSKIKGTPHVLELGAGQGWASSYLKRFILPRANFTVTDISPYSIQSIKYWEQVFDINIDKAIACKSYQLPFNDHTFDIIFCFAAAHHFVKVKETLSEVKRVLKKGGTCIFFYEPTCSKLFYKLHLGYVNSLHPSTPEDILLPTEIRKICDELDLQYTNHYDHTSQVITSLGIGLYFQFMRWFPFLNKILPSSSDLIFTPK